MNYACLLNASSLTATNSGLNKTSSIFLAGMMMETPMFTNSLTCPVFLSQR